MVDYDLLTLDEIQLINKAQQGDRNAFGTLVYKYHLGVVNVVYRICGDLDLAEDTAQDAFIRAWQKLPNYQPRAPFRSWLYRIAVNIAIDILRRQQPSELLEEQYCANEDNPETLVAEQEQAAQVQRAILTLPQASRVVLVLREYEGLSYQEIANVLDIPLGTVMSRLNYARACLRNLLGVFAQSLEVEHA